jgi:hypothetical protein
MKIIPPLEGIPSAFVLMTHLQDLESYHANFEHRRGVFELLSACLIKACLLISGIGALNFFHTLCLYLFLVQVSYEHEP